MTAGTSGILLRRPYVWVGGGLAVTSTRGTGVEVRADNVSLGDVKAEKSRIGIAIANGVRNVVLDGCAAHDNELVGIYLHERTVGKVYRDLSISRCNVSGNGNHGIRIWFGEESGRTSYVDGLVLRENIVSGNRGDGIVVVHGGVNESRPEPVLLRVKIIGNRVTRNTGGIAVRGVTSPAGRWDDNVVEGNVCSSNSGVTGGVNIFWSHYVDIVRNDCSDNSSYAQDGNGILVDHGNKKIRVRWNRVDRNKGSPSTAASGVGVMVLDSQDVDVYGNVGGGNRVGLWLAGDPGVSRNIRVFNNSFVGCGVLGVWIGRVVEEGSVTLVNNFVQAPIGIVAERGGHRQNEDYNAYAGEQAFELNGVFSAGARSRDVGATVASGEGNPRAVGLCGKGRWLGDYEDFGGRRFRNPPAIGAFECE
jgi:hypothetical protein